MMRFLFLFLALGTLAFVHHSFAQQPQQQQVTPSQIAISITNAVNQMAVGLEQLQKENADLKKQLEDKKQDR